MKKQRRSSQETIVQPWGRVLVPPQELYISLNFSIGTKAPTQVKDGNFRLSTRFLEHCSVTSPPTNQKKVTHPAAFTPNYAYKKIPPKTIRECGISEHKPPILLAWPFNKPFSTQNFDVSVCLASLCIGHINLCSVTRTCSLCKEELLSFSLGKNYL